MQAGDFEVLDVSLEVKEEDYFVLMGATGSGKSLLMKAICGLRQVKAGTVVIDGEDVTELEPRVRQIGYVPQGSGLFVHLNVERNLTFGPEVAGRSRKQAKAEIERIVESLGIGHLWDRSAGSLSGGEQQKVALGRALARKPKLLILDEPVSAVDEPTRFEICQTLLKVQKDFAVTTIHVCHSIEEARLVSDVVGVMSEGRLVQVDTLENLMKKPADDQVKRLLFIEDK